MVSKLFEFAKNFRFSSFPPHSSVRLHCMFCVTSSRSSDGGSFVYNKKKIQMFLLNMSFISLVKWKIYIFHSWLRHSWNINIFHFTRWNKIHIQQKIWISSIYLWYGIRLAYGRHVALLLHMRDDAWVSSTSNRTITGQLLLFWTSSY